MNDRQNYPNRSGWTKEQLAKRASNLEAESRRFTRNIYEDTTLVSTHEIADRLGVKPETVHMWRWRNLGFPEPTWQLAVGPIWHWPVVKAWAEQTHRLPQS